MTTKAKSKTPRPSQGLGFEIMPLNALRSQLGGWTTAPAEINGYWNLDPKDCRTIIWASVNTQDERTVGKLPEGLEAVHLEAEGLMLDTGWYVGTPRAIAEFNRLLQVVDDAKEAVYNFVAANSLGFSLTE